MSTVPSGFYYSLPSWGCKQYVCFRALLCHTTMLVAREMEQLSNLAIKIPGRKRESLQCLHWIPPNVFHGCKIRWCSWKCALLQTWGPFLSRCLNFGTEAPLGKRYKSWKMSSRIAEISVVHVETNGKWQTKQKQTLMKCFKPKQKKHLFTIWPD